MSATVVHFGLDECARLLVLQHAGYSVESCGTSLPKLTEHLRQDDVLAVAITEDGPLDCGDVVSITRAATRAPLILFAGVDDECEEADFDLIIRPGMHVSEWLRRVGELIDCSRGLRAEASSTRTQASELREWSERTSAETMKILAKSEDMRRDKP